MRAAGHSLSVVVAAAVYGMRQSPVVPVRADWMVRATMFLIRDA